MKYMLVLILFSSILGLLFHDAAYRWIALRLMQQVSGIEVSINGRIDITHAFPLTLHIEDTSLVVSCDTADCSRSRFAEIHLELNSWSLLQGIVSIEQLIIRDADIEVPLLFAGNINDQLPSDVNIPLIEAMKLERVQLHLPSNDPRFQKLNISRLQADTIENDSIKINGAANLNNKEFEFIASSGSIEALLRPDRAFPLTVNLNVPALQLRTRFSGTLDKPLWGEGIDIDIQGSAADISLLSSLFLADLPFAGAVDINARIQGDLYSSALTDLDLKLDDGKRLQLNVNGKVSKVQTLEGLDLHFEAGSQTSVVSRYLSRNALPGAQKFNMNGDISGAVDDYQIKNLHTEISGADNLLLTANGMLHLTKRESGWPLKSADIDLKLSGKAVNFKTWLPDLLPESGSLDAIVHINGSAESLVFDNITVNFAQAGSAVGTIHGSMAYTVTQNKAVHSQNYSLAKHLGPLSTDLHLDFSTLNSDSAIIVAGQLNGDRLNSRFKGRLEIGSTLFDMQLALDSSAARPYLTATLAVPLLKPRELQTDIQLLNTLDIASAAPLKVAVGDLPSNPSSVLDWLHYADIDLELIADKLEGKLIHAGPFELYLNVTNGQLKVHHKELKHQNGVISTAIEIDNAVQPPRITIRGEGNHLPIGVLQVPAVSKKQRNKGRFSYEFDVTGSGVSKSEFLATMNGYYGHILENGKLTGIKVDLPAFDILQLLMAKVVSRSHSNVDCSIVAFRVNNGVAQSETLFLQTPRMLATGNGKIDFTNDRVDFLVNTEARKVFLKKKTVMHIYGPVKGLKVDTDIKGRLYDGVLGTSVIFAEPHIGLSLAGLSFLHGLVKDGSISSCIAIDQ